MYSPSEGGDSRWKPLYLVVRKIEEGQILERQQLSRDLAQPIALQVQFLELREALHSAGPRENKEKSKYKDAKHAISARGKRHANGPRTQLMDQINQTRVKRIYGYLCIRVQQSFSCVIEKRAREGKKRS